MEKIVKTICLNEQDTFEFGKKLGLQLKAGDLVLLEGELGSGKTSLTRGIVESLNPERGVAVSSPTYVIMQCYPTKSLTIYHLDLYRLQFYQELEDLGFEEFLSSKGIVIVEWADKFNLSNKYKEAILVSLAHTGENKREINISGALNRAFVF